jgi:hypothetical protein
VEHSLLNNFLLAFQKPFWHPTLASPNQTHNSASDFNPCASGAKEANEAQKEDFGSRQATQSLR